MSTVRDRGVIDITIEENGNYILIILDDMPWNFGVRQNHAKLLQDKINDYLDYISSGQAEQAKPGMRPVIRILAQYSYSRYAIAFLERVRTYVSQHGSIADIEWTHSAEDGPFEDGFSDDFVFDEKKIYPRLKKNWAADPLKEISLLAPDSAAPDYSDQMVMFRVMDSFIGMFVQDMGNVLTYITYSLLPEGTDIMKLQNTAFENLGRDIQYRYSESKEPGIYGILAGGDFEAESLCIPGIWNDMSAKLNDDLIICVPTKDIVFFTRTSDRKRIRKMLGMAERMFTQNQKESPHLLFCRDVFIYKRNTEALRISDKYRY